MRRFERFHGLFQSVQMRVEMFRAFLPASRFMRRSFDQTRDALSILAVQL
jgi:hypothetical protein